MRPDVLTLAVVIGVGSAAVVDARQDASVAAPAVADYQFGAGTGLLVFHVHRERAAVFEEVMARIGDGLQNTVNPQRRDQAIGWRLFRSRDAGETAVYVLMADPAVAGADYDPVKMLTELVPGEAPALYEQLKASVVRVERLDLDRLE